MVGEGRVLLSQLKVFVPVLQIEARMRGVGGVSRVNSFLSAWVGGTLPCLPALPLCSEFQMILFSIFDAFQRSHRGPDSVSKMKNQSSASGCA